jgi:hypothetical protein
MDTGSRNYHNKGMGSQQLPTPCWPHITSQPAHYQPPCARPPLHLSSSMRHSRQGQASVGSCTPVLVPVHHLGGSDTPGPILTAAPAGRLHHPQGPHACLVAQAKSQALAGPWQPTPAPQQSLLPGHLISCVGLPQQYNGPPGKGQPQPVASGVLSGWEYNSRMY